MSFYRKRIGVKGEKIALDYLEKQGYQILEQNFKCKIGEIDIIAKDGDFLVFVEVKAKTGLDFGMPEEMVGRRKQQKIIKVSEYYLYKNNFQDINWRIDVVALEFRLSGELEKINLIKNAVTQ